MLMMVVSGGGGLSGDSPPPQDDGKGRGPDPTNLHNTVVMIKSSSLQYLAYFGYFGPRPHHPTLTLALL